MSDWLPIVQLFGREGERENITLDKVKNDILTQILINFSGFPNK